MVEQLQNGQWQMTPQGIAVSQDGQLLDGQHRLTAIAKSGISAQMVVAYNVPDECIAVLDTGRKRTPGDAFSIFGVTDPSLSAASTRIYELWRKCHHLVWTSTLLNLSNQDLYERYQEFGEARANFARRIANKSNSEYRPLIKSVCYAFVLCLQDAGYSEQVIEKFFYMLSSGIGLTEGQPIYAFRKLISNGHFQDKKCDYKLRQRFFACLIKLFNYELDGERIVQFKEPKGLPMPLVTPAQARDALAA